MRAHSTCDFCFEWHQDRSKPGPTRTLGMIVKTPGTALSLLDATGVLATSWKSAPQSSTTEVEVHACRDPRSFPSQSHVAQVHVAVTSKPRPW
eukprot:3317990-Amphidinium_carterae.2